MGFPNVHSNGLENHAKAFGPLLDDDRGDRHGIARAVQWADLNGPTAGGAVKASCSGESEVISQAINKTYMYTQYEHVLRDYDPFCYQHNMYLVHVNISTDFQTHTYMHVYLTQMYFKGPCT